MKLTLITITCLITAFGLYYLTMWYAWNKQLDEELKKAPTGYIVDMQPGSAWYNESKDYCERNPDNCNLGK